MSCDVKKCFFLVDEMCFGWKYTYAKAQNMLDILLNSIIINCRFNLLNLKVRNTAGGILRV